MKNKVGVKSLSQQIRWQLTLLGIGLFCASVVLLSLFSFHAIETTTKNLLSLEAESIVRSALKHPDQPLPSSDTEAAYRGWSDIPLVVRRLFVEGSAELAPTINDEILEAYRTHENGEREYFYLTYHYDKSFGDLYLLSRHDAIEIDAIGVRLFTATVIQSLWSTMSIFMFLFFLIWWLIRRTSEPLDLLSRWAEQLNRNPELPLKADFPIQELNQLAAQLRDGVDKVERYNRREQEFLRYASHELRTPLGIIQASLDTLALQDNIQQQSEKRQRPVIRALRASETVRLLSSALLWLSRDSDRPIEKTDIVPASEFLSALVDEQRYLLSMDNITVNTYVEVESLLIEKDLLIIVVTNLIRNAFQYSREGDIDIRLSGHGFSITNNTFLKSGGGVPIVNIDADPGQGKDELIHSFGIGLPLVKRICQKISWSFSFEEQESRVRVSVRW